MDIILRLYTTSIYLHPQKHHLYAFGVGEELNMVNYKVAPLSDMNLFNIKILIVDTFHQYYVKLKYVENL